MATKIPNGAIVAVARRQHRNVTRAQLLALGLSAKAIQRLVERGWLHREHQGVYSVGTPATTPLELAAAAVLACGRGAVLSHGSALALWGLAKRWPEPAHVTTPIDRRPSGLVVHQATTLSRADIRAHLGIRTSSLARTLLDCAPSLGDKVLTRAVNDALRSPYLTHAQLAEVVKRNPRHRGTKLLNPFVQSPTGPTRSEFEDAFLEFCAKYGLPRPKINTIVCGYEVDALFERARVIVELDGWDFHNDRRAFEADRSRDADMLQAGFVTIRITWERLRDHPRREAARLQTILASRASERAPL
ncbi:MAG TPA: type IV toxin-antitoxin system AbiEi family antitoxin domain-containing protein [Solirubrobacteraceae bacterium]|nr:type IV toxin-antitoxin system AbiEi family antitoxin domain-containing protein [Solirubrobacteraceae bacterium]